MTSIKTDLIKQGIEAKKAALQLAITSTEQKNKALALLASQLKINSATILAANAKDVAIARAARATDAMIDRLLLTPERLDAMAQDVLNVQALADPIGMEIDHKILPNGMSLSRKRVPIGVIGVIYEARPNVTIDIAALCLKTGNASILRGGKETLHSNLVLVDVISDVLQMVGLSEYAVQYIGDPNRELISQFLKLDQYIDLIIPRGGQALHKMCQQNSTIPVIVGGFGISHIFVDSSADLKASLEVIINAKMQRPSACNSLDTLLVHQDIAAKFLPQLVNQLADKLLFVVDINAEPFMAGAMNMRIAKDDDFDQEWLDYTLSIKVVADVNQALEHMYLHNANHSDAIMTNDLANAEYFVNLAGSAAVYVNASTRFTDGSQFGLGAEVAVSTQKIHARGPMGSEELTSYKWVGRGNYLGRL